MEGAAHQFCTFTLAGHLFGIDVREVQEVVVPQALARVPLAPRTVRGLINLRGQIVIAIDLRACLSLPERSADELPINLVVRSDHGAISFLIDEIGDVVEVDRRQFEATPDTVRSAVKRVLRGVCKLEGRLLLVLDKEQALASCTSADHSRGARPDAREPAVPLVAAGEPR